MSPCFLPTGNLITFGYLVSLSHPKGAQRKRRLGKELDEVTERPKGSVCTPVGPASACTWGFLCIQVHAGACRHLWGFTKDKLLHSLISSSVQLSKSHCIMFQNFQVGSKCSSPHTSAQVLFLWDLHWLLINNLRG